MLKQLNSYETSRVWREAFLGADDAESKTLVSQYDGAWGKASSLANAIRQDAAGLTLHDERHFSALWRAVDLLVPSEIKLNRVEVFSLGMAILIHDAAHTTLAFDGGMQAIATRPEWADNVVAILGSDVDPPKSPDQIEEGARRRILFETVRAVHAKEAANILRLPFRHPAFGSEYYLISDPAIRMHLGEVIGRVATSHHWNVAEVARLEKSINVGWPYHQLGPLRPMLLAALMRTADAIQIDSHRAPDFEFALANPQGVSKDHWTAQNRLATGADAEDPAALLVNSTVAFGEAEASAWWVAYELARAADKELRNTDALLRDYSQPRLSLVRVKDVDEPSRFAAHVKTNNWLPVSAEVRVGDTARLVELLGGKGLYGDDVVVPLRELLQNAVDAVRARRALDSKYHGKVWAELTRGTNARGGEGYWLSVSDDGIGMSGSILTGPFLTFGESGWTSHQLREERPGFIGKRFKRIGNFGIGFFSVFMFSDEVIVASRPFEAALADTKLLHFKSGLGLRPILKSDHSPNPHRVTTVSIFLSGEIVRRLMWLRDETLVLGGAKLDAATFTMPQLLGVICPSLDVEIEGYDVDSGDRRSIDEFWTTGEAKDWLTRTHHGESALPSVVEKNVDLMTTIGPLDHPTGRAALNPSSHELGIYSVGGFASKRVPGVGRPRHFFGSIDRAPSGAKREPGRLDEGTLAHWANKQVKAWATVELSQAEQNSIAVGASEFGGDPISLANAKVDGEWKSLQEILDLLCAGRLISAPLSPFGQGTDWSIGGQVNQQSGFIWDADDIVVEKTDVLTSASSIGQTKYWAVSERETHRNSFLGCLGRLASAQGHDLLVDFKEADFGYYSGPTLRYRPHGQRLIIASLELSLSK